MSKLGLTQQYLAFKPYDCFNIINSVRGNVNFLVYNRIEGRYVLTAAAENAVIWDLRLGERALTLRRGKQEVTALRSSPDRVHIAVGYADGVVEIFNITSSSKADAEYSICSLALHKSAVSILRYEENGMRLISGGLDTELVVIDMLEQAGKQRLIGHNAPITDAHFFQRLGVDNIVISSSKDMQIKFWNLDTQFCFKTIVDNRTEIWGLALINDLLIAGSSESGMNVYRLTSRDINAPELIIEGLSIDDVDTTSPLTVTNCGVIQRAGKGRTVNLVCDPSERVITCHGTDKFVESFYFCNAEEAKKRLTKRLKKNKNEEKNKVTDISLTDIIKRLPTFKVSQKIKSLDIVLGANNELRILISLANNSLEVYN